MNERRADSEAARALALARELRVVMGQLKRQLRNQANLGDLGDLTGSQTSALIHLERNRSATVTALARMEGVRPQSMGATISSLEATGLVSGDPDPSDGRKTLWSLTMACRERIEAGRAVRQDWLFRAIQTHLAPAEQAQVARAVELLKRFVE